jgi:hypothetical protein
MFRCVVVATFSLWSLSVSAADWQIVADTKLGQLKLDKASVSKEGKYTAAVLLYEFKELQRLTSPPNSVFNKRQDDVLVDCSTPSLGIRTSRFFEEAKLAGTYTREIDKIKFNPAAPDTMALTVAQAVCAAISKTRLQVQP